MRHILALSLLIMSTFSQASVWPPDFAQSVFESCMRVGGESQCQCVVIRLQEKYTFEDMRLSSTNKLANEALRQMTRTFNVKCLEKEYKEQTLKIQNLNVPQKRHPDRFR